jgi:hypothetical protein
LLSLSHLLRSGSGPTVWTGRALQAESSEWQWLVLRFCIRPLGGADRSWPSWISARVRLILRPALEGQMGHQITNATRLAALASRRGRGQADRGSHSAFPCLPLSRSGMAAYSRAATQFLVRATFSRSTISPRASRPTRCSVFLPGSIPMVTIVVPTLRGMACLLVLVAPQACSLVGRKRGRSIPFCKVSTGRRKVCLLR